MATRFCNYSIRRIKGKSMEYRNSGRIQLYSNCYRVRRSLKGRSDVGEHLRSIDYKIDQDLGIFLRKKIFKIPSVL